MLRWNGTIAQDQDQPVFKNRHQAGPSTTDLNRALERARSQSVGYISGCLRDSSQAGRTGWSPPVRPHGSPADIRYPCTAEQSEEKPAAHSFDRPRTHGTNRSSVGIRNIICARLGISPHAALIHESTGRHPGNSRGAARKERPAPNAPLKMHNRSQFQRWFGDNRVGPVSLERDNSCGESQSFCHILHSASSLLCASSIVLSIAT